MMTSPIGKKRPIKPAAFTLIELMIVAAIIVTLIAVSTPLFRQSYRDLELRDAVYNVSKIIQYGQQKAIIEGKRCQVSFDFDRRAYRLLVWNEEKASKDDLSAGWEESAGRFKGYFYLPKGASFKAEKDRIVFLPNGRCDRVTLQIIGRKNKVFAIKTNGRAGYVAVSEVTAEQ